MSINMHDSSCKGVWKVGWKVFCREWGGVRGIHLETYIAIFHLAALWKFPLLRRLTISQGNWLLLWTAQAQNICKGRILLNHSWWTLKLWPLRPCWAEKAQVVPQRKCRSLCASLYIEILSPGNWLRSEGTRQSQWGAIKGYIFSLILKNTPNPKFIQCYFSIRLGYTYVAEKRAGQFHLTARNSFPRFITGMHTFHVKSYSVNIYG